MKLPLQPNLEFSRQAITGSQDYEVSEGIHNGMVDTDDRIYTTHRPIFELYDDASDSGAETLGRGIYYWAKLDLFYQVNGSEVYYGNGYGGSVVTGASLTPFQSGRVYFAEVGNYLCIIDRQDNKGYYIDSAAHTVLVEIVDVDFPPKQIPVLQLARGAVGLKGRLYVMDTDGTIWNSSLEDPSAWNGGDNINAEMSPDKGVYIGKIDNEIVAIGDNTIEYFYHAGNPTNSPLSSRQDVFHNIGGYRGDVYYPDEAGLFFVGAPNQGGKGVYRLIGHEIKKISKSSLDMYLSRPSENSFIAGLVSVAGRVFYCLSFNRIKDTFVYDAATDYWYDWVWDEHSFTNFPLVDWAFSDRGLNSATRGIMANGDLVTCPYDINAAGDDPVEFVILTGNQDFGSNKYKFMSNVSLDSFVTHAETEETTQTAQLRFYDNGEINSAGLPTHDIELLDRHVSIAGASNTLARAGSFIKRRVEVTVPTDATTTRVQVYNLDFEIREGL